MKASKIITFGTGAAIAIAFGVFMFYMKSETAFSWEAELKEAAAPGNAAAGEAPAEEKNPGWRIYGRGGKPGKTGGFERNTAKGADSLSTKNYPAEAMPTETGHVKNQTFQKTERLRAENAVSRPGRSVSGDRSGPGTRRGDGGGSGRGPKTDAPCSGVGGDAVEKLTCETEWGNVQIRRGKNENHFGRGHKIKFRKEDVKGAIGAYDISIVDGYGGKWQPKGGEVEVSVELSEPLGTKYRNLKLVHFPAGGKPETVETASFARDELGFVRSFSFKAKGFSIYAIVNADEKLVTPRRFYHFYGHSATGSDGWNVARPYQFKDQSNDVVNVQIVKSGDVLREPPVPPDILDEHGEVASMFQGWYVVSMSERPAGAKESKLDSSEFRFKWPVGVTGHRLAFTNSVTVSESTNWDYCAVPLYEKARFLQFNENSETEQEAGSRIIRRKLVAINDESGKIDIKVSDVSAALKNSRNEYFCGWRYLGKDGDYTNLLVYSEQGKPQDTYVTVDDDLFSANGGNVIPLYPYYVSAHFLNFDANAKSVDFVGALFVRSTSNFSKVDVSGSRKGYDFDGWQAGFYDESTRTVAFGQKVTDKNGNFYPNLSIVNPITGSVSFTTDSSGNIRMNEDVTLYGTWAANTAAPYTVIVWQQRVTDGINASEQDRKYYYATHFTSPEVSATTQISESLIQNFTGTRRDGQTVTRQNLTSISGVSNITGEDFTGFRYNRFSCSDSTVAPDGTTVINVYYDRKLMTFTFGRTTIRTGLYGQSFDWPSPPNGSLWQNDNTYMTFMDAFIPPSGDDDMTFTSSRVSNMTSGVAFYKQQFDGTYLEVKTISMQSGRFNITDKFNGFHAAKYRNGNGNEVQLGSKDSSGNYATVQTSGNATLRVYFDRNNYELMYVYEDVNGEHVVRDTGKTVPYQSPLAEYDIAYTNALLDWSGCVITNRTFEGWFEDASLTVPFDFAATMPDGKKFVYAKWAPLKYRVIIDPNGGELLSNEATWFYVDPSKEETIEEYTPTRKYRLDLRNGNYYYHYDQYDPAMDKHTDQYDPVAASNATRKAYYTTDVNDATANDGSDPENRYTYDPGAYAFMGWFEILDDKGTLSSDPFSFGEPPTKPVTLRAVWRRLGVYTIQYDSIDPDGIRPTETIHDPSHHSSGNIEDGYVADAETTLAKSPTNYDKSEWMWEGWQAVDTFNNNIPLTGVRSPGDLYVVKPSHADIHNVIHFRAVYKRLDDGTSARIPRVTSLILDSNENAGILDSEIPITNVPGRVGTYLDGTAATVSGLNQGVWFAGQQNNFSVNLSDFTSSFVHSNGYFLLGWDLSRNCQNMIPSHYANETIGVDKNSSSENVLYAVWEPQIYVEFVNDTGAGLNGVQLYIPGWTDGDVFRVNSVKDAYRREKFTAFSNGTATFNLSAGETLCLVLPDGADKDFATMGRCQYPDGQKLVIERIQPQDDIQNTVQSVYSGEDYMVSGTMKVNPEPVKVRFTKEEYPTHIDVPVRYFIHHPDGTVAEITADDAMADGYPAWVSGRKPLKTITNLGSQTNDLAATLRYSTTLGVVGFLSNDIREQYGHTTIGIGSRDAVVDRDNFYQCEYRTITNIRGRPNGGSYLRFAHEDLLWSRYSQIWNKYDATNIAVYVAFYQRIPVHVTLHKTVVGTEEDKDVPFTFTATYSEHSTNIEYVITYTYQQTREWTKNWWSSNWKVSGDWSDPVQTSVSTNVTGRQLGVDTNLFDQLRSPETVTLKSGERIPFTIFYDRADPQVSSYESTDEGKKPTDSGSGAGGWDERYTQTRTITQVVTHHAAYRYEMVTIQEFENPNYVLTSIEPDPLSQQSGHNGRSNLSNRTYAISSLHDIQHPNNSPNYYDYTPLDTTVFVNTRKTGTLNVTKNVLNQKPGDEDNEFLFTVTMGETVVDKQNYVPPAGATIGPYGKVFTFNLKNGQTMSIPGLPIGATYKVEEMPDARYVVSLPENANGTMAEEVNVVVENTRKADLSITMKDMASTFNGEAQTGHSISTVTGTGLTIDSESFVVEGLKNGDVLLVEHYVVPSGTQVGTYTGKVDNVKFTITRSGEDVTGEYVVSMAPGTLTIAAVPIYIEVSGNVLTSEYDGTEQACRGYSYVVKDANGNVVESDSILVSVDPNYQQAFRKDVGVTYMHLDSHVNVYAPDGFVVQGVSVVRRGYVEITPREVTVTVDDAAKLPGVEDPDYTATVEGLIGGDTVDYAIERTESGEEAGREYAVTPTGASEQGNYVVAYVEGKLKIETPALVQRADGSGIPVEVPFTPELLDELGGFTRRSSPDAISNVLNSVDGNGLMRWENLRLGLGPDEPPLSSGRDNPSDGTMRFGTPDPTNRQIDLGYAVMYELWKYIEDINAVGGEETNTWKLVSGPVEDKGDLVIDLNSRKPTGLYKVVTLVIPDVNPGIVNEIPSDNIVGVLEIDSPHTNTIVAAPWKKLESSPLRAVDVTISNHVSCVNLSVNDGIYALYDNDTYYLWNMDKDRTWVSGASTGVSPDNSRYIAKESPDASEVGISRAGAVWVYRQHPIDEAGSAIPFFVIGQYDTNAVDIAVNGGDAEYTLMSVPDYRDYRINDLDWSGYPYDSRDFVYVVNGTQSFLLKWSAKKSAWCVETVKYRTIGGKTRVAGTELVPYDTPFKAGTGFWFCRHGGEFTIRWRPAIIVE